MHAASADTQNAINVIIGFVIGLAITASYCTPAIIALVRKIPNAGSVVVVNLLLGWTFVGWIIALAMAVRSKPRPFYPPQRPPGS